MALFVSAPLPENDGMQQNQKVSAQKPIIGSVTRRLDACGSVDCTGDSWVEHGLLWAMNGFG